MALSLTNCFYWKIPEAKIPFFIADFLIIFSLHMIERGLKAEKKVRELEVKHQQAQKNELDRATTRGIAENTRDQQYRADHIAKKDKNAKVRNRPNTSARYKDMNPNKHH